MMETRPPAQALMQIWIQAIRSSDSKMDAIVEDHSTTTVASEFGISWLKEHISGLNEQWPSGVL